MADNKAPGADCANCTLRNRKYVPTYAPEGAKVAVVGEGPGYNEAQKGRPFVGKSGKLLKYALARSGVDIDEVWASNTVACWPPNNRTPTAGELSCCSGRLDLELEGFEGDTVIPLGKTAGNEILEKAGYDPNMKISKVRGHWFDLGEVKILPTWHPAYVLRVPGEMNTFRKDIKRAILGISEHPLQTAPEVVFIRGTQELQDLINAIPPNTPVAYDLETDNVIWYARPDEPPDEILMMGLAWETDKCYIIHPDLIDSGAGKSLLNAMFQRDGTQWVAHNGKFDVTFLRTNDIDSAVCTFDTMLAHYALEETKGGHGLKQLALEYYGLPDYEGALVQQYLDNRNDRYSKVPYEKLAQYCAWDVCVTLQLRYDLQEEMITDDVFEMFNTILMPIQEALTGVEIRGVPIDEVHVEKWREKLGINMDIHIDGMSKYSDKPDFNPRSWQQVSKVMFEKLNLPRKRVRGLGINSTAKKAIAHIKPGDHEFVDFLREYRRVQKMDSAYLKNLLKFVDVHGRVHPNAFVHGTEVGRLSYREPAIQTIPRPYEDIFGAIVRSAFIAPPGYKFIMADYSQAELRVAAILSQEPFLLKVYLEGRDLHSEVAIAMYGEDWTKAQRVLTKMFNFSYLYGGSEYSFAEDAGLPIHIARKFVHDYNDVMPRLNEWKREQFELARTQGYVVSPFGRKRRFPLITRENQNDVRKAAVHAPVAGTASDLTQLSLKKAVELDHLVVLTVHDSIGELAREEVAEERAAELSKIMEDTATHYFPQLPWKVDADIRDRWCPLPEVMYADEVERSFS